MKLTRKSFQNFKGVSELKCGWIVEDRYFEEVIRPEIDKMHHTQIMAEFAFKCLYKGERPLSKEDYKRVRYTHEKIRSKKSSLMQVRTKSEDEAFQRNIRAMKIQKGIYPTGIPFEEALQNEEIKKYYEEGRYKKGGFVAKHIVPIHRL